MSTERQLTILVVDDEAEIRTLIIQVMRREGYAVRACEDGRQALDAILEDRPDLVISDIMMPALDGFGLVSEIRRIPELIDLPILLISAKETSDDVLSGLVLSANDYLIKPFDLDVLLAKIRFQLAMQSRHRAGHKRQLILEDAMSKVEEEVEHLVQGLNYLDEQRLGEARESILQAKVRLEEIIEGVQKVEKGDMTQF